jgi:molecular chaperone DnaJ
MTCGSCGGEGKLRQKAGLLGGRRDCLVCGGLGEVPRVRCEECQGAGLVDKRRVFDVSIPPGTATGSTQRVPGEGSPGRRGGPAGDLHVVVRVRPHAFFTREGDVLLIDLPLTFSEAALGGEVDLPILDGTVRMKIPEGTQSGSVFRLRGKGIPRLVGGRGDCHVRTVIETPVGLDADTRELLARLGQALDRSGDAGMPRRQAIRDAVANRVAAAAHPDADTLKSDAAPPSTAEGSRG